jgi:hypothetical protein
VKQILQNARTGELALVEVPTPLPGRTARCTNFRSTTLTGQKELKSFNQDKGQSTALEEVLAAVSNGRPSPFTLYGIVGVSRATFAMLESAASGREIKLQA